MTSSIQATDEEASALLALLEAISTQQLLICKQLDELTLLMQMPSESTLEILETLVIPMQGHMADLAHTLSAKIKEQ